MKPKTLRVISALCLAATLVGCGNKNPAESAATLADLLVDNAENAQISSESGEDIANAGSFSSFGESFLDDEGVSGWAVSTGAKLSHDTADKTEGESSLALTVPNDKTENKTVILSREVDDDHLFDMTGMKYFSFDLWLDSASTGIYNSKYDCGINFRGVDSGRWESGVMVEAVNLRPLALHAGWNHIEVPITFREGEKYICDLTKINGMRIYFQMSTVAGETIKFDNFSMAAKSLAMGESFFDDEATTGWKTGSASTLSYDSANKTKGKTSLSLAVNKANSSVMLARETDYDRRLDLTGANYLTFDLWVDSSATDIFTRGDCGVNFTNGEKLDGGGVMVKAADLRSNELKAGWNHVVAKITYNKDYTTNIKAITSMRFYFNAGGKSGFTVKADNFAVTSKSPYLTTPTRNASLYQWLPMDVMPENLGAHGSAVIDRKEYKQGTGALKTYVTDGIFSVAVVCSDADKVDISNYNAFEFDLYLEAEDIFMLTENQVELTSSGKCDEQEMHWTLTDTPLVRGWNHIVLSFSQAVFTENFRGESTVDQANINYFRIYCTAADAYDGTGLTFRLDNLCFTRR